MNAHVRLSPDGQLALPQHVRDTRGWTADTDIEVVETPDGVLLRATSTPVKKRTNAEVFASLRARINYTGPRYDEADWHAAIDQMFRDTWAEDDRREGR